MKVCPTCDQTFNDNSLSYCLLDGTPLVETGSQPTVVMVPTDTRSTVTFVPPPKKSKTPLIVGLVIIVMLVGIVAVAGILYMLFGGRGDAANANKPNNPNNPALTKPSATPRVMPSPSATSSTAGMPSPTIEGTKPPPANDESDEITPIAWTTAAVGFKDDIGRIYKFECPANGTASAIWGSDIYTGDSSICTAAVHAGVITLEHGGVVTLEFRPGRQIYGSVVRNGITSNTYGEYRRSFVVR